MAGPVKKSPAEIARGQSVAVDTVRPVDTARTLDMTPGPILTAEQAARTHHPVSLVEKFANKIGVEPNKMLRTLKATAFRLPDKNFGGSWEKQEVTNEQMMALLVVANNYDLDPFLKEIYAFPDKKGGIVPIVGVDGWSSMINNHKEFDGMKFEFSETAGQIDEHAKRCPDACTCIIYRKDRSHPTEVTEYLDEVYRPPFVKNNEVKAGPWQSHTKRMLRHKAMIQCARMAFGFTGIHDDDEANRIVTGSYTVINEEPTQAESLSDRFRKGAGLPAKDAPPAITHESEAKGDSKDVIEGELDHSKDENPTEDAPVCDHVWLLPPQVRLGDTVQCRDCLETKIYEPEPEKKPATRKKAAKKKPAPIKDPSAKFMQRIVAAGSEKEVTDILTEIADFQGMSQPKRMVLKKAAQAKMGDFLDEPE